MSSFSLFSSKNNNQPANVSLTVEEQKQQQQIKELEALDKEEKRAAQDVERAFDGRSFGKCGKNMWEWWCDCSGGIGSCCNSDHISFHIFWLSWVGSVAILFYYVTELLDTATNGEITTYFIAVGWLVGTVAWALYQWTDVFNLRSKLAKIADDITLVRKTIQSITKSVVSTSNIQDKLDKTNSETRKTTKKLIKTFQGFKNNQKKINNSSKVNKKLVELLNKKSKEIELELRDQLIISEMKILEQVYNNVQMQDGQNGLSANEFEIFRKRLPNEYQEKFKKITKSFSNFAGNDGVLSRKELFVWMRQFVSQEVDQNS